MTKQIKSFNAWAVFDVNGHAKPGAYDLFRSREIANTFLKIRSNINMPMHPKAKWRVFRVKVTVLP